MTPSAALSRRARNGCALAWLTTLCAAGPAHGATYAIQDLGTLGGTYSFAYGINASGQTVGYAASNTAEHAFRTTATGAITGTDLGTLGGTYSYAHGINDSGQTVGDSYTLGDFIDHAFRTTATGRVSDPGTDLSTFVGGNYSYAFGINTSGQTVGYATTAGDAADHAFRTTATGLISDPGTDLGTLGGNYSYASGINASGQTVGGSTLAGDVTTHAFRTTTTGLISAGGTDLATLGGTYSYANGINASGQTVGKSTLAGDVPSHAHAFRTTATGLISAADTDLGTLGGTFSEALGINTLGQTVGESLLAGDVTRHAFYIGATGAMLDLNTFISAGSGWELLTAYGINDFGQIVGSGLIGSQTHAFRLTLIPASAWDGGGTDNNWTTANNWNLNVTPANTGTVALTFAGTTRLTPRVDAAWSVASITFDNTAGAFTITGPQGVTVGAGGIVNSDADTQTITAALTLGANETFNAAAGALSVGSVALSGRALTVTGAANTTVGSVSGAGTVTKTGAGTLNLNGTQTFDTLTVSGPGMTNVNGSFTGGTATVNANAAVKFNASQTLAALNIGDGVTVTFGDGLPFAPEPDKGIGAVVPEPGSMGLLLTGALGLLARRRFILKQAK